MIPAPTLPASPSVPAALDCRGVCKRYGKQPVLRAVDVTVNPGEVLGFLGPNGAGKTTLIKCVLGLATPNAGDIHLFGIDLFQSRSRALRHVGAVIETPVFPDGLTALDSLRFLTGLTASVPEKRLLDTLELVGLGPVARRPVNTFSLGMRQRLGIAQALLPESRLLLLDEPTNGLDPHGIAGMRRLIRRLAREHGLAILVSSHLLAEIEQICDRFVILHHGSVIWRGGAADLHLHATEVELLVRRIDGHEAPPGVVTAHPANQRAAPHPETGHWALWFRLTPDEVPGLVRDLVAGGLDIFQVQPRRLALEQLFLEQTADAAGDVRMDSFRP